MRALFDGTSLSARLGRYLEEYARVPPAFWMGLPPPYPADDPRLASREDEEQAG
jgi:hypothetical protein